MRIPDLIANEMAASGERRETIKMVQFMSTFKWNELQRLERDLCG